MKLFFRRQHSHVSPLSASADGSVLVRSCCLTPTGRKKDIYLHPGAIREVPTGLILHAPPRLFAFTPPSLIRSHIFVMGFTHSDSTDEFLIHLYNTRVDGVHLAHNTPVALLDIPRVHQLEVEEQI